MTRTRLRYRIAPFTIEVASPPEPGDWLTIAHDDVTGMPLHYFITGGRPEWLAEVGAMVESHTREAAAFERDAVLIAIIAAQVLIGSPSPTRVAALRSEEPPSWLKDFESSIATGALIFLQTGEIVLPIEHFPRSAVESVGVRLEEVHAAAEPCE